MHFKPLLYPAWHPPNPLSISRPVQFCSSYPLSTSPTCTSTPPTSQSNPIPTPSRRVLLQTLAHLSLAFPLSLFPTSADAICGEPDPYFAHYLDWTEDFAPLVDGRRVHYRRIGSRKNERKANKFPVLYIGDAGVGLATGESLELLGSTDRRIIFVDMLGVGESDRVEGVVTRERAAGIGCEEVLSVLGMEGIRTGKELGGGQVHVVAAGFGLMVVEEVLKMTRGVEGGVKVVSVVAEGWAPVKKVGGAVTMEGLVGRRICAKEGASVGDIGIVETLYGAGEDLKKVVGAIAGMVPVLALGTVGMDMGEVGDGVEERILRQEGRLPHLVGTEDALEEMDSFFERIEKVDTA